MHTNVQPFLTQLTSVTTKTAIASCFKMLE